MSKDDLLAAAGSLRRAYEDVDWSATPAGPMSAWSPALRNAVDLALHTRFPVTLLWGPEFVLIYNEAFVPLIADKHPAALGTPARAVFPEAWDTVGPMMESVLAGEGSTWVEDASLPLERHGFLAEAFFTFSYSPVSGADGAIEGVLDIATETTRRVIDRRRLELLNRLRELVGGLEHTDEVVERVLPLLRASPADFPHVEIEQTDAEGEFVVEANGHGPQARFPLGSSPRDGRRPMLAVRLSEQLAPDDGYLDFLRLIASSLGQAIDRIVAREAEHGVAEAMQRSLLTRPLQPDHLQVAVRYLPAAELAQIGGDWYDAFIARSGVLTVAVGDVTGHDQQAAAAMAQVRNLLRGVSYTVRASPGRVLTALDQAMLGLDVGVYATTILAQVEQGPGGGMARTLRWSNAGHPPPVLVEPDGRARLLETPPEPLVGLGGGERADHTVVLEQGATLVLYTDGLVERRRIPLQDRFDWLVGVVDGCHGMTAEALCDHVLAQLEGTMEDDVALLVLRVDA